MATSHFQIPQAAQTSSSSSGPCPQEVPFQCSAAVILVFLQEMVDKGRLHHHSSACHFGFEGKAVGQHPLVLHCRRGAQHKLLVSKSLAPSWDLTTGLDALLAPPFEPLEQVDLIMVALKTALLLFLASVK